MLLRTASLTEGILGAGLALLVFRPPGRTGLHCPRDRHILAQLVGLCPRRQRLHRGDGDVQRACHQAGQPLASSRPPSGRGSTASGTTTCSKRGSESGFIAPASQGAPPWLGTSDVCTGRVGTYAWWEDLPSQIVPVALPIRAGDKVSDPFSRCPPVGGQWPCMTLRLAGPSSSASLMPGRRLQWNGWWRRPSYRHVR